MANPNPVFENHYIYKKEVDRSALSWGITIPKTTKNLFFSNLNTTLKRGERKDIHLLVDGYSYPAVLVNQMFDAMEHPEQEDIFQIRYTPEVARRFQHVFSATADYLAEAKANGMPVEQPFGLKESLAIYSTVLQNVILIECITQRDLTAAAELLGGYDEYELEQMLAMREPGQFIAGIEKAAKVVKLDRAAGRSLARVYDHRCQICGIKTGDIYDARAARAHHIEPFAATLNNDAQNIMIVCPNHHHILHATHPRFDRAEKTLTYPNGLKEKLKLNVHL